MIEAGQGRTSRPVQDRELVFCVYNTMWGGLPDRTGAPEWCRLVADPEAAANADVIIFHIPTLRGKLPPKRAGQLWVAWSMESKANYQRLRDPAFMRQFDLTMTYRLDADVPVTYLPTTIEAEGVDQVFRRPPGPKSPDRLATMFISSTMNKSKRIEYVTELMRLVDIHSYGKVMRNHSLPDRDEGLATKLRTISQYKFDLSFENSISEDYVTEKFYDPLVAGTVPVYLGAPNVDTFAPGDRCFINTADFSGPKELAEYLIFLSQDDAAYAEYFAWKERPFRESFLDLMASQVVPPIARLCALIRDRKLAVR